MMKPRKVMIHIESTNTIPINDLRKKENLSVRVFDNETWLGIGIDQVTVQSVAAKGKK